MSKFKNMRENIVNKRSKENKSKYGIKNKGKIRKMEYEILN
jgi:hypothetical protein